VLAGTIGVASFVFSRPWIGVVAAAATVVGSRVPRARFLLTLGAPIALIESRLAHQPELAWLALALVAADLASGWLTSRARDA
jgi:hypothetical protein